MNQKINYSLDNFLLNYWNLEQRHIITKKFLVIIY